MWYIVEILEEFESEICVFQRLSAILVKQKSEAEAKKSALVDASAINGTGFVDDDETEFKYAVKGVIRVIEVGDSLNSGTELYWENLTEFEKDSTTQTFHERRQ